MSVQLAFHAQVVPLLHACNVLGLSEPFQHPRTPQSMVLRITGKTPRAEGIPTGMLRCEIDLFDGELFAALSEELLDNINDDLAPDLDTCQALVREVVRQALYQRARKWEQDQWRRVHAEAEGCIEHPCVRHTSPCEVVSIQFSLLGRGISAWIVSKEPHCKNQQPWSHNVIS